MRHRKSFNHLGRTSSHRKAMLSNMAASLILHKRITTTVAKAKALRGYVEPLITKSKDDTTHSRRIAFSYLQSKEAVTELFREIAKKVGDRPGGYTRILKLGNRLGDNADMAMMELVDFNETMLDEKSTAKGKTSRRRRGSKKKAAETVSKTTAAPVAEEVKTEVKEVSKAEVKEEAPKAEKTEEVKKEETPKAEVQKEKPAAEKKVEAKDENKEDKGEETKK
ncbi:MAG: 50S ribosomal protein L17 [Epsilonproteobacteria bacterium]|nr:50S ribosomal protein L17 [Campylobacterota bacterium]